MPANRLSRTVARFERLPPGLRDWLLSKALGRAVPLVGTAGLRFDELSAERAIVVIQNRRRVQNHIRGVHAAAMALLAETATGFALGLHLPDDKLPLIRSMKIDYVRRAEGDLRAVAALPSSEVARLHTEPRGDLIVPVTVTDASGESPIVCEMRWAWIPKKR